MSNRVSRNGFSVRESRLLYERESSFGDYMKEYGHELRDTYFSGKEGVLDRTMGGIGAAANLLLKGTDHVYRGAVGQPHLSTTGIAGNTRADVGALLSDIVHLRPLRALGDAWSLATADVPLDFINAITGNTGKN